MAEEPVKNTESLDEQAIIKEQKKANAVKKVVECLKKIMNIAISRGDNHTVWYKKGLYYTCAVILFVLGYIVTTHGVEIIDWLTALVQSIL